MPTVFGQPAQPRTPEPARPRTRIVPVVVAGLVGLLIGVVGTLGAVAVVIIATGPDDSVAAGEQEAPSSDSDAAAPGEADAANDDPVAAVDGSPYEPTVDDFDVHLSVKEQACFGSAGCNVTLRTEPEYIGAQAPSGSWEVTYEITGIEDSPMIRTFELDEDEFFFDPEAFVGTTSADAEIGVEITGVVEGF